MRGNSGFLRLAVIGCLLVCSVSGGPPRPRRMMRETFASSVDESVPMRINVTLDSDKCSYNGKEVPRSSVTCEKKNGCREIETHGECCPKILCGCELNGTIYDNGDKIVDPENPCEVCVCRGGEINCNALTCYSRNDCKNVTYAPGVCCPEYANCPPLENVELNLSNETTTTENYVSYSTGSSISSSSAAHLETSTPLTTTTTQTTSQPSDIPVGIKIKEITKPEEIRITDDRPKVFKTIKSSEAFAAKSSSPLHSQEILIEPENIQPPEHIEPEHIEPENIEPDNIEPDIIEPEHVEPLSTIPEDISEIQQKIEPEIEQHTTFSFDDSADQPIRLESSDLNTVGHVSMGPKIVRQTDIGLKDEIHTTIAPFSSENEIVDEILTTKPEHVTDGPIESTSVKHNTSVLQVGDSVVIFDRSGQTQSIPLRVAGLQRGEDTDDEDDEHKEQSKTDGTESSSDPLSPSTEVFEVFYYEPKDSSTETVDFTDASGDGLYGFINGTDDSKEGSADESENFDTSTVNLFDELDHSSSGYSSIENFTDPMLAQPTTVDENTLRYYSIEGSSSTSEESFENFGTSTSTSQLYSSESTTTDAYEDLVQHDQNINFPHITDDLSIHGSRMEDRMEDEDKLRVNSKVVGVDLEKIDTEPLEQNDILSKEDSNTSQDYSSSTIAPSDVSNEIANFRDTEGRSPGEPFLIPEWERNHTTVAPPVELLSSSSSNETGDDSLLAEISSHDNHLTAESTTNLSELSSTTDSNDANDPSTSESGYEAGSLETHSTSGPSPVRETNNLNLFFDGTADFFRIQKKIWDSSVV